MWRGAFWDSSEVLMTGEMDPQWDECNWRFHKVCCFEEMILFQKCKYDRIGRVPSPHTGHGYRQWTLLRRSNPKSSP
jgi:hypothetical protein